MTTESLETMDGRIYFGHPKDTYNTEYELNCLKKIKELYPGYEIVNPRDIPIEEKDKNPKNYAEFMIQMNKYYFPAIETCNLMIVAKTRRGKISPGIQKEIPFAKSKNVPIEYLDVPFPEDNWSTFPVYYINETGLGFEGEDGDNAEEIDIESAISFLDEHGTDVEYSFTENRINYLVIYDYSQEQGIPGLAIPEVLLDYIKKKGYVKEVDTKPTKEIKEICSNCESTDIYIDDGEYVCRNCDLTWEI